MDNLLIDGDIRNEGVVPLCTAPVLLLTFNRLETAASVMREIRRAAPSRLYIASDGPRPEKPGERELINKIRSLLLSQVDWPCEVKTLWRDHNRGCKYGVSEAITWFFQHEDMGIILEDDCLPSASFFPFCTVLLNRFVNDETIMGICADYRPITSTLPSNTFGRIRVPLIWGWATWRRVWKRYDADLTSWTGSIDGIDALRDLGHRSRLYWKTAFDGVKRRKVDTWDFQLSYLVLKESGVFLHPFRNLVCNIGFGAGASHTTNPLDETANLPRGEVTFPLREVPDRSYDNFLMTKFFRARILPLRLARRLAAAVLSAYQGFR